MSNIQWSVIGTCLFVSLVACSKASGEDEPESRVPACDYAAPSCVETAVPDWIVPELDGLDSFMEFDVYGNSSCNAQAVIELNPTDLGPEAFLFRQFLPGQITTAEECEQSGFHVTVMRRLGGKWEEFDHYVVEAVWNGQGCDSLGAGKLGPNEDNENYAYPYSWIDMGEGVERARIIVSAEVGCDSVGIQVGFLSDI